MKNLWKKRSDFQTSLLSSQSLLLDFIENSVEPTTKSNIEKHLKENKNLQDLKNYLEIGKAEIEDLQSLKPPQKLVDKISKSLSLSNRFQEQFKTGDWPTGLKWAAEGIAVISMLAISISFIPWNNLVDLVWKQRGQSVLFKETMDVVALQKPEVKVIGETKSLTFPDEGAKNLTTTTTLMTVAAAVSTTLPIQVSVTTTLPKTVESNEQKTAQGYVFRGTLTATNVPSVTAKLVTTLNELGGRKAGEVRLGWPKGTGSYFHFTIPEQQLENATNAFKSYGKLVISKEKHDRVMPVGISRVIIDVVEAKP